MSENLDVFFQDDLIRVPIVFGAVNTYGLLDAPDVLLGNGLVESTSYSLIVKVADFPTEPVAGNAITVDSVSYRVNSFSKIDDGKLARIGLSK
jgi:hypothetical protein